MSARGAEAVREWAGADVGLAVTATEGEVDTRVEVAIAAGGGTHRDERRAFLAGAEGRRQAALAATMVLWEWLRAARAS